MDAQTYVQHHRVQRTFLCPSCPCAHSTGLVHVDGSECHETVGSRFRRLAAVFVRIFHGGTL